MALRLKTISVPFATSNSIVATAVRHTLTAQTVSVPEVTSRTFKSVVAEYFVRDSQATAFTPTAFTSGLQIDAVAVNDVAVSGNITNSGEHHSYGWVADHTSYFATNFDSDSHSVNLQAIVTGGSTVFLGGVAHITYEYDDSNTTRAKTVRIPSDGHTTTLTTTPQNMGSSSEIPNLDTFLPESTKLYRQIFAELHTNEAPTAITAMNLETRIDSGTPNAWTGPSQALNSALPIKLWWDLKAYGMTTSATHALQARSVLTNRYQALSFILIVTYDYDHSDSSTIIQSLVMPLIEEAGFGDSTQAPTGREPSRHFREFWVQEPATIALVQSGYYIRYTTGATVTSVLTRAGSQAYRTYTHNQGTLVCGQYSVSKRIDAGGVNGAGMSLARGRNSLTVDYYSTGAGFNMNNVSGELILNYTSGKHANGDGVHNHTIYSRSGIEWPVSEAAGRYTSSANRALCEIPESNYFINAASMWMFLFMQSVDGAFAVSFESAAGEQDGAGWETVYTGQYDAALERGMSWSWARARKSFMRWNGDNVNEDKRANPVATRTWRCETSSSGTAADSMRPSVVFVTTYHSISYNWEGSVSNSAGGTVNIDLSRKSNEATKGSGQKLKATSRAGNGTYSFIWYDDTEVVFAVARETDSLTARSTNTIPTTDNNLTALPLVNPGTAFDINMTYSPAAPPAVKRKRRMMFGVGR